MMGSAVDCALGVYSHGKDGGASGTAHLPRTVVAGDSIQVAKTRPEQLVGHHHHQNTGA